MAASITKMMMETEISVIVSLRCGRVLRFFAVFGKNICTTS
jgi:hypothetical protein